MAMESTEFMIGVLAVIVHRSELAEKNIYKSMKEIGKKKRVL